MNINIIPVLLLLLFTGCGKDDDNTLPDDTMYFPANTGTSWQTISPSQLGWNQDAVQPLKDFLAAKHTKSFMILVNGRIAMEEYFNGHSQSAEWEWNSAGKTLVGMTTGVAQEEAFLSINDNISAYLGTGWTNMPLEKESSLQRELVHANCQTYHKMVKKSSDTVNQ